MLDVSYSVFGNHSPALTGGGHISYQSWVLKVLLIFLVWCLLWVVCWPVAIMALVIFPIIWIIALPFRLAYMVTSAFFAFIKAVLFLPARLFGYKS